MASNAQIIRNTAKGWARYGFLPSGIAERRDPQTGTLELHLTFSGFRLDETGTWLGNYDTRKGLERARRRYEQMLYAAYEKARPAAVADGTAWKPGVQR